MEDQKIYVISNSKSVKIGRSKSPTSRLGTMSTATHETLTLEYETEFCSNPRNVEQMCHMELEHKRLNGEWFDLSSLQAIDVVKSIYTAIAILSEYSDDKKADIGEFSNSVKDLIEIEKGMYKVNHMVDSINDYRKARRMGNKQLATFFRTNMCKQAIAYECVYDQKPLSSVKVSHRGIDGGTWVSRSLLIAFFRWASGCFSLDDRSAPAISKAIEKAIQKQRLLIK